MLFVALVGAGPITVQNHSFETFGALFGCVGENCGFNYGPIDSWLISNSGGSFRPGTSDLHFDQVPDGEMVAFTDIGFLEQTVSESVIAGFVYTLLVDVGNRKNFNQTGTVALLIGGVPIFADAVAAPEGGWATHTVVYTALPEDVGKAIGIRLGSNQPQGLYDNVRLSSFGEPSPSPIPEPASVVLTALGLAALAMARKQRRQQSVY